MRSEKEWMEVCYLNEVRTSMKKDRQTFKYRTEKKEIRTKKEERKMRSDKEQMEVYSKWCEKSFQLYEE